MHQLSCVCLSARTLVVVQQGRGDRCNLQLEGGPGLDRQLENVWPTAVGLSPMRAQWVVFRKFW